MSSPEHWRRVERFHDRIAPVIRVVTALLVRLRVSGGERVPASGAVMFAANHTSVIDPLVVAVALDRLGRQGRFLAVAGLFSGLRGWIIRTAGMIAVERGAGPEPMVDKACDAVAAGQSVVVYPEGTIPRPGERLPARRGAGLLALRAGVPVVPLAHRGLESSGRRRPRLRRRCDVVFGAPLDLSAWEGDDSAQAQAQAAAAILDAIRALLPSAP